VTSASLKLIVAVVLIGGAAGLGWAIFDRLQQQGVPRKRGEGPRSAPVEVAPIEHGAIQLRRTFSGALESPAEFVVGPKISGRIVRLGVALADTVQRGQVVAW
jgi:multidrug efflux pump subunit AcrA (membrane-fusion protein)